MSDENLTKAYVDNENAKAIVSSGELKLSEHSISGFDPNGGIIVSSGPHAVSLPSGYSAYTGNLSDSYTVVLGDSVEDMLRGLKTTLKEQADDLKKQLTNLSSSYEKMENKFNEINEKIKELDKALRSLEPPDAMEDEPDDFDDIPF